jgi:hypothetical protein
LFGVCFSEKDSHQNPFHFASSTMMAVQEQFPTDNQVYDEAQAIKDIINCSVTHPIDSFVDEMARKEWIEPTTETMDIDRVLASLDKPMTTSSEVVSTDSRQTHKRTVTNIDETMPDKAASEGLDITAEDWRIGFDQLRDIEPTPVSELMKRVDPIPLLVETPPAKSAPLPLTLPEEMPVGIMAQPVPAIVATAPVLPRGAQLCSMAPPPLANGSLVCAPRPYPASIPKLSSKPVKERRTRRKKEPEVTQYVGQPRDVDVVLGRGGKSNHHPGNKRYRDEVQNLQKWYKASDKSEKTELSQHLVNFVHSYGGHFVKQEKGTGRWYVVSNLVARRKASQALREHLSSEERLAKKVALAMSLRTSN